MTRVAFAAALAAVAVAGCGDDITGTPEEFCELLAANVAENTTIFQPGDPTDPDELVDALQALTDAAPEEVHGEMEVLTQSVEDYRQALDQFDPDDPATAEALESLDPDDEERIREAQDAVVTFAREECGIDLEQTGTTTPPVPSSAPSTTLPAGTAV